MRKATIGDNDGRRKSENLKPLRGGSANALIEASTHRHTITHLHISMHAIRPKGAGVGVAGV